MTPLAIVFLILSLVIVWGGLIASIVFLSRRPAKTRMPDGGFDEDHTAEQ